MNEQWFGANLLVAYVHVMFNEETIPSWVVLDVDIQIQNLKFVLAISNCNYLDTLDFEIWNKSQFQLPFTTTHVLSSSIPSHTLIFALNWMWPCKSRLVRGLHLSHPTLPPSQASAPSHQVPWIHKCDPRLRDPHLGNSTSPHLRPLPPLSSSLSSLLPSQVSMTGKGGGSLAVEPRDGGAHLACTCL